MKEYYDFTVFEFCQKYTGVTESMGFLYISMVRMPAVQTDSDTCVFMSMHVCVSWVMYVRAKR